MSVERKLITAYEEKGYQVNIRLCQPCLLVEVNGEELSPFFQDVEAARKGATREIKARIEAKEKKETKK